MSNLTLITGPMMAGKTSRLLRMHACAVREGKACLLVGSALDAHSPPNAIRSHPGLVVAAQVVEKLADLSVGAYDCVFINECQFFEDPEIVGRWLDQHPGLSVVACGLDSDYKREPFGPWLGRLIPHATEVIKLVGLCSLCNQRTALFTQKISGQLARLDVCADYRALCRKCYIGETK